jgi:hypothetical protein
MWALIALMMRQWTVAWQAAAHSAPFRIKNVR